MVGPLISRNATADFLHAVEKAKEQGGKVLFGGTLYNENDPLMANYVIPAIVEAENHCGIVKEETFAPILYVMKYSQVEEAI